MDQLRHQMMDAAHEATWIPAFGLERELDWLRNMDDWMISKKRYWGLALPIYPCDACGHGQRWSARRRSSSSARWSAGSSSRVTRRIGPWVDEVSIACEQCGAPVPRVRDVGNVSA